MKKSARRDLQREEKCISLKIKPAGILTFYTLLIFGQGLIFFNLNVYWTHFSWWEFLSKMRAFPESSFEVRRKKCKKTVKRDRTTGKCLPFTKRNALQFHARKKKKKKDKEQFYHMSSHFAWIWTLTGICCSTDSEHRFCCFTDCTKLYVCAHRVLFLHDLRQDLLWYCPEFPENGLTAALDWPAEPAGPTGGSRQIQMARSPQPPGTTVLRIYSFL